MIGAWEQMVSDSFDDAFENIKRKIDGRPKLTRAERKWLSAVKTWYKWKCLETHEFTHVGQDIHNGKHYSFIKDQDYDFSDCDIRYVVNDPSKFEFMYEYQVEPLI